MKNCFADPLDDGGRSSRLNAVGFFVKVDIEPIKMDRFEMAIYWSIVEAMREDADMNVRHAEALTGAGGYTSFDVLNDAVAVNQSFSVESSDELSKVRMI